MTTETDFQITEVKYEGITTWYATGQVEKAEFLLALLEQFNESLTERIRDGRRAPKLADVSHFFGMPTECMDGSMTLADQHDGICEDPETCDFDIQECFWTTLIDDEQLYPSED